MDSEEVHLWKTKRILKLLREASGNGTSMVSIILRPGESIAKMNQKLTEEYGTAGNIKSRVNRQSVETAIVSAQQRLKLYTKCPRNGLAIFSGEVVGSDRKEKKLVVDFEPCKPINTTMYMCDNRFHIEALEALLVDEKTFVFVIVDGNGYTLGTLSGNTRDIVDNETVRLPSKTRRGGQSSNRYARLRDEAKYEWVKKVCERLKKNLLDTSFLSKIEAIFLAGNADVKHDIQNSGLLDPRIKAKIKCVVDVPYGGAQGFNHAINLTKEKLGEIQFVKEKDLLMDYFTRIARNGNVTFGIKDTMTALEAGAVEKLIVHDQLKLERCCTFTGLDGNPSTTLHYIDPDKPADAKSMEGNTIVERMPLLDWFVDHHNDFGAELKFVSESTTEGSQFVKGFGGIGAMLRYKMDFNDYEADDEDEYMDDANDADGYI